ncbi:hypothetical protein FKP32DRAFT_1686791 [Trametes sanguinea]|nr:hypothetical protein FKP32DRAFT_1686791 [Trametes sanguinea]
MSSKFHVNTFPPSMSTRPTVPKPRLSPVQIRTSSPPSAKKQIHTLRSLEERAAMPQTLTTSRGGPIANCVLILRDFKLSSQELHDTLHDVVARTGAAGKDAAVHDWRTYIQRYEEIVSGASRAGSQLRALIKTYLILQQKKRESTADDMVAELTNLRTMLETYHFDAKKLCESLRSDIAASYGNLTPDMLETSSSSGICDRLVAEPEQLPQSDPLRVGGDLVPEILPGDASEANVKTKMLWVLHAVFNLRLKKPRNRNGEPSTTTPRRSQSAGSVSARSMSDPGKAHVKIPGKHRVLLSLAPCGKLEDFEDSAETEPTSPKQNGPLPSESTSQTAQGRHQEPARNTTPDAFRSTDEIRAMQLQEEAFRELVQAIDIVLKELDRLAPEFDTFSELAQHLRNEITAYINAFSAYRALQTLAKKNALEEMHARVEATSVHWTEFLDALGEGLPRISR